MSETALLQGRLWGQRARDWAEIQEHGVRPAFEAVLDQLGPLDGVSLLDVGCGAGLAAQLASARGARLSGVDAANELLEVARERVPAGDFRLGDINSLPSPDASFDVVIGFNSFQYASDPVAALREARRVLRPSGRVGIVVWGSIEECEAVAHFLALRSLVPPPPGAPAPLAGEQHMDQMAREAGFTIDSDFRVDCPWHYQDLDTALRGLMSAGPVARFVELAGEQGVRDVLKSCLRDYRQADGSYLFRNRFRGLCGQAP